MAQRRDYGDHDDRITYGRKRAHVRCKGRGAARRRVASSAIAAYVLQLHLARKRRLCAKRGELPALYNASIAGQAESGGRTATRVLAAPRAAAGRRRCDEDTRCRAGEAESPALRRALLQSTRAPAVRLRGGRRRAAARGAPQPRRARRGRPRGATGGGDAPGPASPGGSRRRRPPRCGALLERAAPPGRGGAPDRRGHPAVGAGRPRPRRC